MKKASKTKISRTYAMALYEAAAEKKIIGKVWEDVEKLRKLLHEDSSFSSYLSSPLWEEKDKNDVLVKTAGILKLDKETLSCLEILTENHRVSDLAMVLEDFTGIYYQKNGIAQVEVETVKELTPQQDKKLKGVLKKLLSGDVVVNYAVNPAILGGLRVKCGSKMFDDSLACKLNYLENVMKGK